MVTLQKIRRTLHLKPKTRQQNSQIHLSHFLLCFGCLLFLVWFGLVFSSHWSRNIIKKTSLKVTSILPAVLGKDI